jgi:hypothetical protein
VDRHKKLPEGNRPNPVYSLGRWTTLERHRRNSLRVERNSGASPVHRDIGPAGQGTGPALSRWQQLPGIADVLGISGTNVATKISRMHCATPSLIRCGLDWCPRRSFGPGRAQPATAPPTERDEFLTLDAWGRHWTAGTWREYLAEGELESKLAVIRQRTHTGRPLGNAEFVQDLEKATQRQLTLQKRGPREKIVTDRRQSELTFGP